MSLELKADREILRGAVQREIFCKMTGESLDVRSAVLIEARRGGRLVTSLVVTAGAYDDTVKKNIEQSTGSIAGVEITVYDGRKLFA